MRPRNGGAAARCATLLHRLALLCGLLLFTAAGCASPGDPGNKKAASEPGPIQIALHPAASRALPAYVAVRGLDAAELSSLRERAVNDSGWPLLLKVTVGAGSEAGGHDDPLGNDSLPAVQGRYAVTESAITFTPLFPFDPGRPYHVEFNPSQLPRPRQAAIVAAVVRLPAVATEPTTVVTAVRPSAAVVPENLLRIYIEFSAPMGNGAGLDFVKLIELSGPDEATERVEAGAFLPVEANFWSPDHTRYTLFFDPGRVKDGILPNRQSGRPLRAGRRYVLDIAPAWTDANGLPLVARYRHAFRAGPAVDEAIALSAWTIARPAAGTRDRLVVRFPRPLDHGILARALGVEAANGRRIDGGIGIEAHDTVWFLTPVAPWQTGEYNLVAQPFLEDPQGNQIGRAFEAFAGDSKEAPFRVPFTVGAP